MQSVGAAETVALAIGHNPIALGYWAIATGNHSDTGYQQSGTHFADLGRMTGRVNPTCH